MRRLLLNKIAQRWLRCDVGNEGIEQIIGIEDEYGYPWCRYEK